MSYTVKHINLRKPEEEGSAYWVGNINDEAMQALADELGVKLNIVESNKNYILYMGSDEYKNTGFLLRYDSTNTKLYLESCAKGETTTSSGGVKFSQYANMARFNSMGNAKTARLSYVKTKYGLVFGISNIADLSTTKAPMYAIITQGKDIKTNTDHYVYYSSSSNNYIWADVSDKINSTNGFSKQSLPDDFVSLYPFIACDYIMPTSAYGIIHGRNYSTGYYSMMVNDKEYFVPYAFDDGYRIALELPEQK